MIRKSIWLRFSAVVMILHTCSVTNQQDISTPDLKKLSAISTATVSTNTSPAESNGTIIYTTQAGDTLPALAARFGVPVRDITFPAGIKPTVEKGLLPVDLELTIPDRLIHTTTSTWLIPDSELIFSPSASDFDIKAYIEQKDGYLSQFYESIWKSMPVSGADAVSTVALQNSINPRLLLALLEYRSGCVLGELKPDINPLYLADKKEDYYRGLYRQLMWLVEHLNDGYYGWRSGSLTELTFTDGSKIRLAPQLNAASVALMNLFAQMYDRTEWQHHLAMRSDFPSLYADMFGDPWVRAEKVEPLYDADLTQPPLSLPYLPGHTWSYTAGPHSAWEKHGPQAAIDFNPGGYENSCEPPQEWVVAMSSGRVARLEPGVLLLDLDGDGNENTGWVVLYVHLLVNYDIKVGDWLENDTIIGFPSCLGGPATSAHIHIARKYNGEWMLAGGAVPFTLDGWVVSGLQEPYFGTMSKDGQTINSCSCATADTRITRPHNE